MYKEIHEQYLYVDFFPTDLEAELSIFVWINCLKFYRIDFSTVLDLSITATEELEVIWDTL